MRLRGWERPGIVVGVRLGSSLSGSKGQKIEVLTANTTLKASYYYLIARPLNTVPIQENTSARPANKICLTRSLPR